MLLPYSHPYPIIYNDHIAWSKKYICIWRTNFESQRFGVCFTFQVGSAGKESAHNAGDAGSMMATHSSILVWRISWTEGSGGLQSMGSQRVVHDWVTNAFTFTLDARLDLVLPACVTVGKILNFCDPRFSWLLNVTQQQFQKALFPVYFACFKNLWEVSSICYYFERSFLFGESNIGS